MKNRLAAGMRLLLSLPLLLSAAAHAAPPAPPNLVALSEQLVTSGQPSADWLATLGAQGFDAVIYLAPPTVGDAVREEPLIVARQGLVFINIPVRFDAPSARDFETFAAQLGALKGRKVLVHCQVNMRASTLSFLYRTVVEKAEPRQAYEQVARIWTPSGPWKTLMLDQLRQHQINFDPF
ncbi:protein tyrosine phosphatase family protein [Paucibacter sediminis]|uniref:Protein tyrosine phosphatase family protein n=1 Tax=Paucibacter sediminis TaxID=3019553 RepID=A0AA95SX68_9BURK|nr:protein tyrosine phosphatase family protein [Paucibacter sp. S2-9]WIT12619.1 protein tyrosine phosphatase family protein [Paucibacter sp. S2-9]